MQKQQLYMRRNRFPLLPRQITCRGHAMSTRVPEPSNNYCQLAWILDEFNEQQSIPLKNQLTTKTSKNEQI